MEKSNSDSLRYLTTMLLIRKFEEVSAELYTREKIRGFLHLYIGEEAVAAGVILNLRPEDAIVATYREHGHALARGISVKRIMAEMFGKVEGISRGRGGSMHLFDKASNFYGGHAIVAAGLPLVVGLALAFKMKKQPAIACCFFGEGAIAEGEFHEAMNLAALWQLPVLFVCENNLYAMGTALNRSEAQTDLCLKAHSYNVTAASTDGMDLDSVKHAAMRALEKVRSIQQPFFLECRTYRYRAHSMFDPELYRSKEEVDLWKTRDPIIGYANKLKDRNELEDSQLSSMVDQIDSEINAAIEFAEQGTLEDVSDLERFVYA